eukprot:jgi/Tetstr1/426587/TSEL_016865.t1
MGAPMHALWSVVHGAEDQSSNYVWEAIISQRAVQDFRSLEKARNELAPVMQKLEDLLCGNWSNSNAKMLANHDGKGSGSAVPVYEIQVLSNLRLIWQVEFCYLPQLNTWSQCILVWSIVKHKAIDIELKRISRTHRHYTAEHAKMCRLKDVCAERTFVQPISLPPDDNKRTQQQYRQQLRELQALHQSGEARAADDEAEAHESAEIEFPLHPSEEEYDAMMHQGRRQLFVTAAPELCIRVKNQFSRLRKGVEELQATQKLRNMGRKLRSVQHTPPDETQQLSDGDLRGVDDVLDDLVNDVVEGEGGDDEDDEEEDAEEHTENEDDAVDDMLNELPDNLAEVEDSQWPLFVTFDKLAAMVEGMLRSRGIIAQEASSRGSQHAVARRRGDGEDRARSSGIMEFLDFEAMWSSFDTALTKRRDTSLVWTEICSVIKGSGHRGKDGRFAPLSRQEYKKVSERMYPEFKESRDDVYTIYEVYERRKAQESMRDLMDRLALCANGMDRLLDRDGSCATRLLLHEVYCDEVQDLVQLQIKLLLQLCSNAHGLYLSGDTAQTIANGAAFRFEHTKSGGSKVQRQEACSGDADSVAVVSWARSFPAACEPAILQLTKNYRSHRGILKAAGVVLDLLTHFFKGSVDSLQKDWSDKDGHPPLFFHETSVEALDMHLFSRGVDNDECELGADQVILVRDMETKRAIEKRLPTALVLTIYEAKGREFNDVLIYNFFSSSPAQSRQLWHALRNFAPDAAPSWKALAQTASGARQAPKGKDGIPTFVPGSHNRLCSELKHLYTAVTRARKQLWFFDDNKELREPMMRIWLAKQCIKIESCDAPSQQKEQLARKSSPQQWAAQGQSFFKEGRYDQAAACFRTSLNKLEDARVRRQLHAADAYVTKGEAEKLARGEKYDKVKPRKVDVQDKFLAAARLFESLPGRSRRETSMAARCFEGSGQLREAAELLYAMGRKEDIESAVELFITARATERAADAYEALGQHGAAISVLLRKRLVDAALTRIGSNAFTAALGAGPELVMLKQRAARLGVQQAQRQLREGASPASRLAGERTMALVLGITDSYEEQVALLEESHCTLQLVAKLAEHGEHSRAARVLMRDGEYVQAAEQLRLAGDAVHSPSEQAAIATSRGRCLLTAAHLAVAPRPRPHHQQPALIPIATGAPIVELACPDGAVAEAVGLVEQAAVALEASLAVESRALAQEALTLGAVCRRDVPAALEHVRLLEQMPGGREAWARALLSVLSLALSREPGSAAALFGGENSTAWQVATTGLQAFAAAARRVLPCCASSGRSVSAKELRRRRRGAMEDIRLLQPLCGVVAVGGGQPGFPRTAAVMAIPSAPAETGPDEDNDAWETLARVLAQGLMALVRGWDALADNHRAHKLCLRPVCTGIRLYGQCFKHPTEQPGGDPAYQERWRVSIARQAAMVDLMGWGGLQWLTDTPHAGRHLEKGDPHYVLRRLRHWVERLAECLIVKGSDLALAPAELQAAMAQLPRSVRASLAELVTRVWLRRECTTAACVPGKVLHGALLLLQLREIGSLAYWKPQQKARRGNDLHSLLVTSLQALDYSGAWDWALHAGLQFAERVLRETEAAQQQQQQQQQQGGRSRSGGFLHSRARDGAQQAALDPAALAGLLEILVAVAAVAAKGAEQVLLPEGYVRMWLAPRPRLVAGAASVLEDEQRRGVAAQYLERCVAAVGCLMFQLDSPSWAHWEVAPGCAPRTGGHLRRTWSQAEVALRLATAAAVGVVNSSRKVQPRLMHSLRAAHHAANLGQLSCRAMSSDTTRVTAGWQREGVAAFLHALAGGERQLKDALHGLCSAETGGPMLLSRTGRLPAGVPAWTRYQCVAVDATNGVLTLKARANKCADEQLTPAGEAAAMRMLRGAPQPAAATGEDGDGGVNQEEDAGSQHQVAAIAKIIAWIRNIWSERAKRVMEDRHLTEIKMAVAEWQQCGLRGARAYGGTLRKHGAPLPKRLLQARRDWIQQRDSMNLYEDEEYEMWQEINERWLPAIQDVLLKLNHRQPLLSAGGRILDVFGLAQACLEAARLLEDATLERELEPRVEWARRKAACLRIEACWESFRLRGKKD